MRIAELRNAYLEFFASHGHRRVASSALVPSNDPTLLFTNAGMVPFKDALLGHEDLGYRRATSAQRCVRAGGKHNDLENVGYTARHLTFFEMLGNFSFGDYFKEETVSWAWQFVTEVMELPVDRICVTHHPSDDETRELWIRKMGVPEDRVIPHEDNFWAMGDTGPCGPCTELFFDHGPEVAGGPPGSADEDGDRYLEFWNLVFPQFDRSPDGELAPLPSPGVDTGMGLERMAAILQHKHSVFETDLFEKLIFAAADRARIPRPEALNNASLRVIADHIRSSAFLIADGVMPGNEDRSYVLRRIIRRGLRHGHRLGIQGEFFHSLVAPLVDEMGEAHPAIAERQDTIEKALETEERRFNETLHQGMELLNRSIASLDGTEIPGEVAFRLYDTYGFPVDLTADVARERELTVDMAGFETEMEAQRQRARAAAKFDASLAQRVRSATSVDFLGYDSAAADAAVVELFRMQGESVEEVQELADGEEGVVLLDRTPFYAESGGQVGDTGSLTAGAVEFAVRDTLVSASQHLHQGRVTGGVLAVGDRVSAAIDADRRGTVALNHSGTHLLHAALRRVLGDHVTQKGSLVAPDRLRFDFSHGQPVTEAELEEIEAIVNVEVQRNAPVATEQMGFEDALAAGAMALFGEKYGDEVRVLRMGDGFSVELCGGTHVQRTGDIALLKIVSETGIASGVRRIAAVTGLAARDYVRENETTLAEISRIVKGARGEVAKRVAQLADENKELAKQLEAMRGKLAASAGADLAAQAERVGEVQVLAAQVAGDAKSLPKTLDSLRAKLDPCVIVLAAVEGGRISLIAGVSKGLTGQVKAVEAIGHVGSQVGAKGGGRPDMARAGGGDDVAALPGALSSLAGWVSTQLGD
ncbi:MAG: alanine--tRNA ligase [Pseudomonadota bacterium]